LSLFEQIKEVTPITALSSPLGRFWKEDIKIARDFSREDDRAGSSLGENFLRQWAVSIFKSSLSHPETLVTIHLLS